MTRLFVYIFALYIQASLQKSIGDVESGGAREENPVIEGEYGDLFEGDIIVTKESRSARTHLKWPEGKIPYLFAETVDSRTQTTIRRAMEQYHSKTCIKWVPRTTEMAYVQFRRPTTGCNSAVGRSGRLQILNLGRGCTGLGTVIHEMMHAVGFYHEHTRPDRDQYVTVFYENINTRYRSNFNIARGTSTLNLPYDYSSVMHYNARAFSTNGQYTILPKDGNASKIGRRVGLSDMDVKKINAMYNCAGKTGGGVVTDPPRTTRPPTTRPPRTTPPTTRTSVPPGSECVDRNANCAAWSQVGACYQNPSYMQANCRKSCNKVDHHNTCDAWARIGQCLQNPGYMLVNCKKSCNVSTC